MWAAAREKNPYLNYNEEQFVENMQAAGRNYAAVTDRSAEKDYDSAKAPLTRAREQSPITVQFWRDKKQDERAQAAAGNAGAQRRSR